MREALNSIEKYTDENCRYSPWLRAKADGPNPCFFGQVWKTWGLENPYAESSPNTHGHLKPTRVQFPAFSAAAVPYHWMLKEKVKERATSFDLNVDNNQEPVLDWSSNGNDTWVQEITNQKALFNCFFEHLEAQTSLVFFYAPPLCRRERQSAGRRGQNQ